MICGKNPSIFEKLCIVRLGVILICLEVAVTKARAIMRPTIVTASAAIFIEGGMVMIGVLDGRKFEVMSRPAIMLPQARRSMGAVTAGWFSLIGDSGVNRGEPMVTKNTTRRLYTAVKEVAISVRARAQAFK